MENTYGLNLKLKIYGGSHDDHIGVIATGLPKGFEFDPSELSAFMSRRAPGKNSLSTPRKEADLPIFLSGVNGNTLNGETLEAIIKNTNQKNCCI